jgi:hypothetical protein
LPAIQLEPAEGEFPGFDGKVITINPPRVLELLWGTDTLRFELRCEGSRTVLTFTDTFDELGKAARDGAGWHVCLDRLGFALDDAESPAGPPEGHAVTQAWVRFLTMRS